MLHPLIFRLLEAKRALGFRKLLWVLPRRLVRQDFLVLMKDLRLPLPEVPSHDSLQWTGLTEGDISRVCAINPRVSGAEIRRRLDEGQECRLCWIGGSLVHYRWETTRPAYLPFLGKTLWPLKGDIHVTEVFTHPAFRGRDIHSFSSRMAQYRFKHLGFTRSIAVVASWNAPSLRVTWEKSGFALAGTVGYRNVGLGRYYFATGDVCLDRDGGMYVRPCLSAADQARSAVEDRPHV